mgnify:FL=1
MAKKKYYQRPDGLFETSRTVNGKRIKFRGRTCAEVDRKILEYNAERKSGRKVPVIADEWFEAKEAEGIGQGTYRPYNCAVERIKKAFPMTAGDVRPLDIKRYLVEFEGKGYSRNTVQTELYMLKAIFSYAVLKGDIDVSPAAEAKHSRNLPYKPRHALTEEEERKVEEYRGEDFLLGMMLLYTGCRRGELLALNWQDIDRKAGTITVNKKLNYAYGNTPHLERHLKNKNSENNDGSGRVIPLLSPLADVLPNRRLGLIFHNEQGQPLTAAQLSKRWKTYCRNTGLVEYVQNENGEPIPTYPITPHCFRHSFTTICYEAGLDVKTMAAFIGDTEQVTTTVYAELRARHHASGAERVNAYLAMRAEDRANSAKAE